MKRFLSKKAKPKENPHFLASLLGRGNFTGWTMLAMLGGALALRADGQGSQPIHFQFQQLKSFGASGVSSGTYMAGKLIEGRDGRMYGMTGDGGSNDLGTVFSIHKDGSGYALLHSFSGLDGAHPGGTWLPDTRTDAPLLEASDGVLYGTTRDGWQQCFGHGIQV